MENLFKDLMWKCYENELKVDMGLFVDTYKVDIMEVDRGNNLVKISEGRLSGWNIKNESAIDALKRMHKEVDEYLSIEEMEDEEFITDKPHGVSEQELAMKEAGMKEADFR